MFISIVTVVYNGEKTIRRTIESVLCQEFKDYEYIIVDGLSKDNTINIAKEYEERFEGRLRIYSERDKGIYDAMNKGIKLAKGDYIWLVNADDWIEQKALKAIYECHKKYGLKYDKIIQGGLNIRDCENLSITYASLPSNEDYFIKRSSKLQMGLSHPAAIVPKYIYNDVGLYDDRYYISADVDFSIRCYRKNVRVVFLYEILTNMLNGGVSNQLAIGRFWHDWVLRYDKFSSNRVQKWYYLLMNLSKLILRKILPVSVFKEIIRLRMNNNNSN